MKKSNETVNKASIIDHVDLSDRTDWEIFQSRREKLSEILANQLQTLAMYSYRSALEFLKPSYIHGHSLKEAPYLTLPYGSTQEELDQPSESSTKEPRYGGQIVRLVDDIFGEATNQDFEDGVESRFSRDLLSLVRRYGASGMSEISYLILYNKANPEAASGALRWLGRVNDPTTFQYRLWLLEKSLSNKSAQVRDGAGLGLVSMAAPSAIPYLKEAIQNESYVELRQDLEQALEELLEGVSRGTAPENNKEE